CKLGLLLGLVFLLLIIFFQFLLLAVQLCLPVSNAAFLFGSKVGLRPHPLLVVVLRRLNNAESDSDDNAYNRNQNARVQQRSFSQHRLNSSSSGQSCLPPPPAGWRNARASAG